MQCIQCSLYPKDRHLYQTDSNYTPPQTRYSWTPLGTGSESRQLVGPAWVTAHLLVVWWARASFSILLISEICCGGISESRLFKQLLLLCQHHLETETFHPYLHPQRWFASCTCMSAEISFMLLRHSV